MKNQRKTTTQTIRKMKGRQPLVCLTAYDTVTASLADEAGVDLILVGDSVGTTLLGFSTTVPVTLEMMIHHTAAVSRAKPNALVVADVPFAVGWESEDELLRSCRRLMQEGGAEAVKLEGGAELATRVAHLVRAGVPVMGHLGLMPQQYHQLGGYRRFGRSGEEKASLLDDARALEEAGVFCLVAEMVATDLMEELVARTSVPVIGIGSGEKADGQILVCTDVLGFNTGNYPSFAKVYTNLAQAARTALAQYAADVRQGKLYDQP